MTPENDRVSKETVAHRLSTRARPKQTADGFFESSYQLSALSFQPNQISVSAQQLRAGRVFFRES